MYLAVVVAMWLVYLAAPMLAGAGERVLPTSVGAYDVVWDSLGKGEHDSMPLGNGDVCVNAWTEPGGDLVFYISKIDAWDDNARLVKVGRVRIHLDPSALAEAKPFVQKLSLSDGTILIKAGKSRVRLWVDAHRPVIRVEVDTAGATQATASIELWRG